ncbi:hypothetical protein T06_7939 [Trichinella sp. T6]|nr:hypothetical protein T06_7939 [Trichinella sp. T6]
MNADSQFQEGFLIVTPPVASSTLKQRPTLQRPYVSNYRNISDSQCEGDRKTVPAYHANIFVGYGQSESPSRKPMIVCADGPANALLSSVGSSSFKLTLFPTTLLESTISSAFADIPPLTMEYNRHHQLATTVL